MKKESGHFACDACGRRFKWHKELAGRLVRCPCGQGMTAPDTDPASLEEASMYDLAPEALSASPAVSRSAPRIEQPPAGPMRQATGSADDSSRDDRSIPDRMRDLYLPLILLGGGFLVLLIAEMASGRGVGRALVAVSVNLLVGTTILLITMLIVAKARGIELGRFGTMLLKLAALVAAPQGGVLVVYFMLLRFVPFGGLLSWVVGFVLLFALLGVFFDLDESDTWYSVGIIFILGVGLGFLRGWLGA